MQFPNETLLADALKQGVKLKEAYKGLVTTRKGLAMRTAKEQLKEVRAAIDPENKFYAGVENLNPTCTWTMAAVPKSIERESLNRILKENSWRAVAAKSVPDKSDKMKNFWFIAAGGPPKETCWVIHDINGRSHRCVINPKDGAKETKRTDAKESPVAEQKDNF